METLPEMLILFPSTGFTEGINCAAAEGLLSLKWTAAADLCLYECYAAVNEDEVDFISFVMSFLFVSWDLCIFVQKLQQQQGQGKVGDSNRLL